MRTKPLAKTSEILLQELENELLVYDLQTNKAFCLNETSSIVFQLCDGTRSVAEISQTLNKHLKQSVSEDFVWLALDSFKKDDLLEEGEQFAINFKGLTRRQVIKKVGLASMVALPLISSVVAPNAAMAASAPAVNCSPTPLAPGCLIPFSISSTSPCSVFSPASFNSVCNALRGSQCSSGMSVFQPGGCFDFSGNPPSSLINCLCA
ncbi:MAG TPA: PqqD family peptide modification chaperone [Pyrinomonadaceae bacterium]|nr:PqqD family peptide modification chaperone [Pyrinomonadaceae bacterium]